MLTRCIYTTKAGRSVSKQGHLQPRCHSKARLLSRQLWNGLFCDNWTNLVLLNICSHAQSVSKRLLKRPQRVPGPARCTCVKMVLKTGLGRWKMGQAASEAKPPSALQRRWWRKPCICFRYVIRAFYCAIQFLPVVYWLPSSQRLSFDIIFLNLEICDAKRWSKRRAERKESILFRLSVRRANKVK